MIEQKQQITFIGSKKDVLPAVLSLEVRREALREVLGQTDCPIKRRKLLVETRVIRQRQMAIYTQLEK